MKRILYTSDPYEPSGTIGVYTTEEERAEIIAAYLKHQMEQWAHLGEEWHLNQLTEEEFSLGVYHPS